MNAIEIKDVNKTLGQFSMKDINLNLPTGCIMGLVGKNGAGKTTLIKLILGIAKADSGTITVLGCDNRKHFKYTKQYIGYVPDSGIFDENYTLIKINKLMGGIYREWNEPLFLEYAKKFHLSLDQKIKEFSKGMKAKLSIMTAICHGAKLLIMDEPTTGLDPVARDEIVNILFEFTREEDCSVLISSHIVSDLEKLCDYICLIDNGQIQFIEEKDEILEKYVLCNCTTEQYNDIPKEAVISVENTNYSLKLILDKSKLNGIDLETEKTTLEDVLIHMIKE
ncbi:MAG TPA: ABC transporter ATP-binding protein [Candidatus Limousia pullorum]|uniref:ABC transporter ATP-binding protein n=1 Tax=Candidatus Limousia pullorum TaxID=2840860 RepID=A0A9D1S7G3_9FIRM|nr:ABC transporter ATP-binding protein [Acutalibacteraceae bacterium]HIU49776.1 ABC transporter ATP-binding protein [Candidatus Limousia pullorum]